MCTRDRATVTFPSRHAIKHEQNQTFEPGGKQGSTMRDPRKIIGESIREVALKMMGQKFVSVRRV